MISIREKSAFVKRFLALMATLVLISVLAASPALAEAVGKITKTAGRADILKAETDKAQALSVGMDVSIGDIIRTKSDGSAEVQFIDGSAMNIGPKSRLGIDEYLFKPDENKRNASVKLYRGKMGFDVSKAQYSGEGSKFEMKTRTAVAGIRGTKGILYTNGIERVYVTEGLVAFTSGLGSINVAAGFVGEIILGKPPIARPFSAAEYMKQESGLKGGLKMKDEKKDGGDGGPKSDKLSTNIISATDAAASTATNTMESKSDTLANLGNFLVNSVSGNTTDTSGTKNLPVTDVAKTTDSGVTTNFPSTPVNVNVTFP